MRDPDIRTPGGAEVWRVPLGRVAEWVETHPERVHQASRGHLFSETWRDLWYCRIWLAGADISDEIAEQGWFAVSLRDIRHLPNYPRLYLEAEWEVHAEIIARETPPINGDGLHDSLDKPILIYQFHGLPEEVVLDVRHDRSRPGPAEPFTQFAIELLVGGPGVSDQDIAFRLSRMVNELRVRDGRRPLDIAPRAGLLIELEDGSTVSEAVLS